MNAQTRHGITIAETIARDVHGFVHHIEYSILRRFHVILGLDDRRLGPIAATATRHGIGVGVVVLGGENTILELIDEPHGPLVHLDGRLVVEIEPRQDELLHVLDALVVAGAVERHVLGALEIALLARVRTRRARVVLVPVRDHVEQARQRRYILSILPRRILAAVVATA